MKANHDHLRMFDGCCGLKGASRAMAARGWDVTTLDNDPRFEPDICMDIRRFTWDGPRFDLMWFSPPCTEFALYSLPWVKDKKPPNFDIVFACMRIIEECSPEFWVIENVRGAVRWLDPLLGRFKAHMGPFFLWGNFPPLERVRLHPRHKNLLSGGHPERRAFVPWPVSMAVCLAVERWIGTGL